MPYLGNGKCKYTIHGNGISHFRSRINSRPILEIAACWGVGITAIEHAALFWLKNSNSVLYQEWMSHIYKTNTIALFMLKDSTKVKTSSRNNRARLDAFTVVARCCYSRIYNSTLCQFISPTPLQVQEVEKISQFSNFHIFILYLIPSPLIPIRVQYLGIESYPSVSVTRTNPGWIDQGTIWIKEYLYK